MSLHAWVTAGLAAGLVGLSVAVAAGPPAVVTTPTIDDKLADRVVRLEGDVKEVMHLLGSRPRVAMPSVREEVAAAAGGEFAAPPTEPGVEDAPQQALEERVAALERDLTLVAQRAGVELADPGSLSTEELLKTAKDMSIANQKGQRGSAGYQAEELFWR